MVPGFNDNKLLTSAFDLLWLVIFVLGGHFLFRAFLFPGMGGDEGEHLLFSQSLEWGYQYRNPPLLTWFVIGVQRLTGPTVISVLVVKFSLLALIYFMLWRFARLVLDDARLALLAAAAPLGLYYVAWDSVWGYGHSIMVTVAYLLTFWVLYYLKNRGNWVDYALLGFVLALGVLSKYSFVLFILSLTLAALSVRAYRPCLTSRKILISLFVLVILTAPHFHWLADQMQPVLAKTLTGEGAPAGYDASMVQKNLFRLVPAILGFLSPLLVVYLLLFPKAFAPKIKPVSDDVQLLERYFIFLGLLMVISIFLVPGGKLRTHYMFALIPFPVYLMARVQSLKPHIRQINRLAFTLVAFGLVTLAVSGVKYWAEPLNCKRCQHHIPYGGLAEKLRLAGFDGGTVFAWWHPDPIAGNLRAQFPEDRVVGAKYPVAIPPVKQNRAGQCLLVWPYQEGGQQRASTIGAAKTMLKTNIDKDAFVEGRVEAPLPMGRGKNAAFGYILFNSGSGDCR